MGEAAGVAALRDLGAAHPIAAVTRGNKTRDDLPVAAPAVDNVDKTPADEVRSAPGPEAKTG